MPSDCASRADHRDPLTGRAERAGRVPWSDERTGEDADESALLLCCELVRFIGERAPGSLGARSRPTRRMSIATTCETEFSRRPSPRPSCPVSGWRRLYRARPTATARRCTRPIPTGWAAPEPATMFAARLVPSRTSRATRGSTTRTASLTATATAWPASSAKACRSASIAARALATGSGSA